jgi:uroporphyrin-III C-methyltransferase
MLPSADFAAGTVWLVGAGPGDRELLTRKAERLLGLADIVFHDALASDGVLALVPPHVERVSVGKRSGRHSKDQPSINALILAAARAGRRVVRLKGGDPSIFGRSGEEIAHLAQAGITVRICPGITAASAAAAAGGASLTLRGLARSLTLVTAHARAGDAVDLDWTALARAGGTVAVYMGRAAAPIVARELIAAGRDPGTPVLIVVNASLPGERVIRGRLSALAFLVDAVSDHDPTLLLIGEATIACAAAACEIPAQAAAPGHDRVSAPVLPDVSLESQPCDGFSGQGLAQAG